MACLKLTTFKKLVIVIAISGAFFIAELASEYSSDTDISN